MQPVLRRAAVAFPVDWSHRRAYRPYLPRPHGSYGAYFIEWDPGDGVYGEGWVSSARDRRGVLCSGDGSYHPIRIAQYALHLHARWLDTRDPEARDAFVAQSLWLAENQKAVRGIQGCYPFPFAWKRYGARDGFLSAMAQGEAVSVLLRAAEVTGLDAYAAAALRAAEPLHHAIEEGGVVCACQANSVILEEAAASRHAHILNGWIFAAWGLFELQPIAGWAGEMFERTVATLRGLLPQYDAGSWSYYSLASGSLRFKRLATIKYHAFHIAQLRVLASMTNDPFFDQVADRWQSYYGRSRSRAAVWRNAAQAAVLELLRMS